MLGIPVENVVKFVNVVISGRRGFPEGDSLTQVGDSVALVELCNEVLKAEFRQLVAEVNYLAIIVVGEIDKGLQLVEIKNLLKRNGLP